MFVGHLAAGLVIKARVPRAPLLGLLCASVAPDFLCGALMLCGLERVDVEGSLVYAHLRSEIGYSHSLLGTALVAMMFAGWGMLRTGAIRIALALAVLSHYALDALMHRPDMPLLGFGAVHDVRLGTSLALHPLPYFLCELAWCGLAAFVYERRNGRLWATFGVLMALYTNTVFGFAPPPIVSSELFGAALIVVFVIAGGATYWAARTGGEHVARAS